MQAANVSLGCNLPRCLGKPLLGSDHPFCSPSKAVLRCGSVLGAASLRAVAVPPRSRGQRGEQQVLLEVSPLHHAPLCLAPCGSGTFLLKVAGLALPFAERRCAGGWLKFTVVVHSCLCSSVPCCRLMKLSSACVALFDCGKRVDRHFTKLSVGNRHPTVRSHLLWLLSANFCMLFSLVKVCRFRRCFVHKYCILSKSTEMVNVAAPVTGKGIKSYMYMGKSLEFV